VRRQSCHPSGSGLPVILAAAATGVLEMIVKQKADPDRILTSCHLNAEALADPNNEISLVQYCRLFEEAAKQCRNSNFGLHFGMNFKPQKLGALGYLAISSPTLGAALRNIEYYFPAHQTQTSFGFLPDSDIFWLSYRIFHPSIQRRRQDAELSMGVFLNIFRQALGPKWCPLEVRFEHDAPEDSYEHERLFGAPVRFGRRTNAFAFRRGDLTARMPQADPDLVAVLEPLLRARRELRSNPEDFAATVSNQVKLHLGEGPLTREAMAAILGIPDHLFQKQLRAHRLTFPDLLNAARRELALHYLDDPAMSLTEVAHTLGYSELSAFSRAFRSWTGTSPQRFRRLAN